MVPFVRCGLCPWKALLTKGHEDEIRAWRHRLIHTKRAALCGLFLAVTRRRLNVAVGHAVALAGMRLLKQLRMTRAAFRNLRIWAVTARVAARSLAMRTLGALIAAVQLSHDDKDWAVIHRQEVLQRGAMRMWRKVAVNEVSAGLLAWSNIHM